MYFSPGTEEKVKRLKVKSEDFYYTSRVSLVTTRSFIQEVCEEAFTLKLQPPQINDDNLTTSATIMIPSTTLMQSRKRIWIDQQ